MNACLTVGQAKVHAKGFAFLRIGFACSFASRLREYCTIAVNIVISSPKMGIDTRDVQRHIEERCSSGNHLAILVSFFDEKGRHTSYPVEILGNLPFIRIQESTAYFYAVENRTDAANKINTLQDQLGAKGRSVKGGLIFFPFDCEESGKAASLLVKNYETALTLTKGGLYHNAGEEAQADDVTTLLSLEPTKLFLADVIKQISSGTDIEKIMHKILESAVTLFDAERGFVIVRDLSGTLSFTEAYNVNAEAVTKKFSSTIAEKAFKFAECVVTTDADKDPFTVQSHSVTSLGIKSAMAVPLIWNDSPCGVLYLDSRKNSKLFTAQHAKSIMVVGRLIGPMLAQMTKLRVMEAQISDSSKFTEIGILGNSEPMMKLLKLVENAAKTNYPILVSGETGSGKELVARAIHLLSDRRKRPFVPINCAAIPQTLLESELFGHIKGAFTGADFDKKGYFEIGNNGTLFFDEIEEMPAAMQTKLLRVIEDGTVVPVGGSEPIKVDVRIVAATNIDIDALVADNKFRQDLFFRLNVIRINVPALRERMTDLPELVKHFCGAIAKELGLPAVTVDSDVLVTFSKYRWPGNIRELRNELRRAALIGAGKISLDCISAHMKQPQAWEPKKLQDILEMHEKIAIQRALEENGGDAEKAAHQLGIDRSTLWRKMKKYSIA